MSSISLDNGIRIHALQTGTVAVKERQRDGGGRSRRNLARVLADGRWTEPLPILAWLIEHPEGLILVDTGETPRVAEPGYFTRWQPYFRFGLREHVAAEDGIGAQLRRLGFAPEDVRRVVLTHFHTDHAGGLPDVARSEIVCSEKDYRFAKGLLGKVRGFLPQHWPADFAPTLADFGDGRFGPFATSTTLTAAGDVHLLPTPGHTPGHLSVAVEDGDTVVLLAGDASYTERLMLDGVVDGVTPDVARARESVGRIQELVARRPTIYLPTHDPESVARLLARQVTSAPKVAA
ncbi:N-acyl homoserine lactonase family protein [Baekduia alba]|uniref:N-acyl homoserine lactonase family protein n=1 Tax=Baekduia alba TaxID=2997333 RepID=UPI002341C4C3|nr:N-acyl homoserine lactonase family protein [Baekduia alba]